MRLFHSRRQFDAVSDPIGQRTGSAPRDPMAGLRPAFGAVSAACLYVALAAAPLPYGSFAEVWVAIWLMGLSASLACELALDGRDRRIGGLLPMLLVASIVVLWAVAQAALPVPIGASHPFWALTAAEGLVETGRISADASGPIEAIGGVLAPVLGFVAAYLFVLRHGDCWRIVKILALSGGLLALASLAVEALAPGQVLFEAKEHYVYSLTGPFVNRNTAATYFGMCALAGATLAYRSHRDRRRRRLASVGGLTDRLAGLLEEALASRAPYYGAIALLCLSVAFLTGSRAGALALCLGVAALATLLTAKALGSRAAGRFAAVALLLPLVLIEFFGHGVSSRLQQGLEADGRWAVWSATAKDMTEHRWAGAGLGVFADVFPSFRPVSVGFAGVWEKAHSTPLEMAAGLGLPLAAAVLGVWCWLIWRHSKAVSAARRSFAIPAFGVSVLLLVTLHAMVDFSLQIPGFSIPFGITLGATLAHCVARARLRGSSAPVRMAIEDAT